MKKITVVTWCGGKNYGTYLQAFALCKYIESLGYNISLLSGVNLIESRIVYWTKTSIKLVIKCIKNLIYPPKKIAVMESFRERHLNAVNIHFVSQLKKLVDDTDIFVTGSDQIWNTYYRYDPVMFLDFAENKKRIAYASSIGTDNVNTVYREKVKSHLLQFRHIGVREKSAVTALSNLTDRNDIVQVLDPTFLLSPKEWGEMSQYAKIEIKIPQTYILCYFIGTNQWYIEQVSEVKRKTNIHNIIIIPLTEKLTFSLGNAVVYKNASPVEFIYLIQHASLVCTDSFHATALSINHSVPFVEFMRFRDDDDKSQNSRIYDLLKHYGLMDRIYDGNNLSWTKDISYDNVQEILSTDRKFSINYLVNAIEN